MVGQVISQSQASKSQQWHSAKQWALYVHRNWDGFASSNGMNDLWRSYGSLQYTDSKSITLGCCLNDNELILCNHSVVQSHMNGFPPM